MDIDVSTAQITPFPLHLVRPGIRQLLNTARRHVQDADAAGKWKSGDIGITASFVTDLIAPLSELFEMSDLEVAEMAIKVSLLCLHVLHHNGGEDHEQMSYFMDLQMAGSKLEANPALQRRAG